MSYSSLHERMAFHAFHYFDSSFGVFFNIFLFLLTIWFKGKKVLSYFIKLFNYSSFTSEFFAYFSFWKTFFCSPKFNMFAHSRSFIICFQKAVLFFCMRMLNLLNIWALVNFFLKVYFFYIQYFQWKVCRNCFWARKYILMHSTLIFESLSLCALYLWKCVSVFATKFFGVLV